MNMYVRCLGVISLLCCCHNRYYLCIRKLWSFMFRVLSVTLLWCSITTGAVEALIFFKRDILLLCCCHIPLSCSLESPDIILYDNSSTAALHNTIILTLPIYNFNHVLNHNQQMPLWYTCSSPTRRTAKQLFSCCKKYERASSVPIEIVYIL